MPIELWQGLLIPFAGTTLGAACVFFLRNNLGEMVQRALTGFAAGVMVAASIWSLLLPAMEQAADMGRWSFVPSVRNAFRCSGAHRCDSDHPSGGDFGSGTALRPELCRRSDGLCGSGRIDPGDVSGKALQYRDYSVCGRFYPHDDAGCGAGCLSE